ncbi:hypothetical protein KRR40_31565 [Niabella defluvii]|nr:hypothetical protein KRR40_31565 [Niabella sp. I65]
MNMVGVFAGAFVTNLLGKATDQGNLGKTFVLMSVIVAIAVVLQLAILKPKTSDYNN